jgi:cell division protein FtsW
MEKQPGFGPVLSSLVGLTNLTGWPDRDPVNPYGAYTDFIVAVWAEEFGFIGVLILIGMILALLLVGLKIAKAAPDSFGRFLAFGLTMFLVLQMTVNFWVTLGLLPTKGLTFPFLSYGGSSLCVSLAAIGVLLNVARQSG